MNDKVVLITGANRGIGKALVDGLLETYGAKKIYAAVRNLSSVEPLIEHHGKEKVIPVYIDLAKPEMIPHAAMITEDVDIVINNAGILELADPFSDNFLETLQHQMEINVYGLVHMAQTFIPILKKKKKNSFHTN